MPNDCLYIEDFHLVEKALDKEEAAIRALQKNHSRNLITFLVGRGASLGDAHEVVDSIWADGLEGKHGKSPMFLRYSGKAPFSAWLKTVVLNTLLDRKRTETRRKAGEVPLDTICDKVAAEADSTAEAPLLELLRDAIRHSFSKCSPEEFVLLLLHFREGVYQEELAVMWGRHQRTISQLIEGACTKVRRSALEYIRTVDASLDLQWEDFLEVCQVAGPGLFGSRSDNVS